jgi:hypothetical protein
MIEYENNELFYNQMYLCIGHRCVAGKVGEKVEEVKGKIHEAANK